MDSQRLARKAARRRGPFTRTDARECGFSASQVRRRLHDGDWRQIAGPVLAPAGLDITPELRDRAFHLAVPDSVLAGPSAARALRIPVPDTRTYLLLGVRRRFKAAGCVMLYGELAPHDCCVADGARVTWRERTIFDCLRVLDEGCGRDLLDRALQQGWATLDSLAAHVQCDLGRWGIPKVVRHIRAAASGTRSVAERRLVDLLHAAGIDGWSANRRIEGPNGVVAIGDVVFARERVIVEVDGWAFHTTADGIASGRTCSSWTAGRSCASPGATSPSARRAWSPRSGRRSPPVVERDLRWPAGACALGQRPHSGVIASLGAIMPRGARFVPRSVISRDAVATSAHAAMRRVSRPARLAS